MQGAGGSSAFTVLARTVNAGEVILNNLDHCCRHIDNPAFNMASRRHCVQSLLSGMVPCP